MSTSQAAVITTTFIGNTAPAFLATASTLPGVQQIAVTWSCDTNCTTKIPQMISVDFSDGSQANVAFQCPLGLPTYTTWYNINYGTPSILTCSGIMPPVDRGIWQCQDGTTYPAVAMTDWSTTVTVSSIQICDGGGFCDGGICTNVASFRRVSTRPSSLPPFRFAYRRRFSPSLKKHHCKHRK